MIKVNYNIRHTSSDLAMLDMVGLSMGSARHGPIKLAIVCDGVPGLSLSGHRVCIIFNI